MITVTLSSKGQLTLPRHLHRPKAKRRLSFGQMGLAIAAAAGNSQGGRLWSCLLLSSQISSLCSTESRRSDRWLPL